VHSRRTPVFPVNNQHRLHRLDDIVLPVKYFLFFPSSTAPLHYLVVREESHFVLIGDSFLPHSYESSHNTIPVILPSIVTTRSAYANVRLSH
jgi:hypothetical protein